MIKTEDLKINISQGRGVVKWAPFATMPKQYENIDNILESQNYVPKPILNDDLLQEIELKLRDLEGGDSIIGYWCKGYEVQVECVIAYIDDLSRTVIAIKGEEYIQIKFENIYEVSTGGMF